MSSVAKRKRQLLSIVLCVCMIMTSIMVEKKEAKAADYYNLSYETDGFYKGFYAYFSQGVPVIYNSGDSLVFGDTGYSWTKEGGMPINVVKNNTFVFPSGEWIVSDYNNNTTRNV